ncbi:hypothetical protein [Blautia obeum]|uniref:hypothetical protein n=1 Tax=Blautia obeum TaxID=40520 RepID=UPI003565AB68
MPAYDEVYLDSMLKKHRYLFKLIGRNCEDAFSVISCYLCCEYRKRMDEGNPLYLNKTPKQILGEMGIRIDSELQISEKYDEFILAWMADIYTYMQWKYAISSEKIAEKILPEDLYKKYYPLHEASIQNAVDKLKQIYSL